MYFKYFLVLNLAIIVAEVKCYGHYSNNYYYNKYGKRDDGDWKKCEMTIGLPSGNRAYISEPYMPRHWNCGNKSELTQLDPMNRRQRKEYYLIKYEVESTWGWGNKLFPHQIVKIERINNPCLWDKFRVTRRFIREEAGTANEWLLFHGSPAIPQIIDTGLDERYGRISGWFGAGLYFGSHSRKSHDYSPQKLDGTRQLILFRVALGSMHIVREPQRFSHAPKHYNSVKGDSNYPEFVVYRGEQTYPQYLITYK